MRDVYIVSDNIISPLGVTSAENFDRLANAVSGIRMHNDSKLSAIPFYASLFNDESPFISNPGDYTRFEQLLIASVSDALKDSAVKLADERTILIISSTKGNISLLETAGESGKVNEKLSMHRAAKKVAAYFNAVNEPLVVSNACISGLLAMITGMRFIRSGKYDHAVVAGADLITKFVLSGFQSFQAVSSEPCKPFDESRNGINLGEAAGTVVLSASNSPEKSIRLRGGSVSNDANHISGPSRTGEELQQAISRALKDSGLSHSDIQFISTHGTATLYNDEMEAKAVTLSGLQDVPLNSLKGFYGHTLGAAGLIESIISMHSMKNGLIIPTKGFEKLGVTQPVNVCSSLQSAVLNNCLKTASGFGGCNAAIVMSKQ